MKPEHEGKVAMVDDPLGNLLVWGTVVTGKPMGTILTKDEMKQVIDKMIEIKTKHARAFFATYGDMADAFARNEVTVSAIGWEAVAVWAKQKGKTIAYTIPQGRDGHVHGLPVPAEGLPEPRARLQDDQPHHLGRAAEACSPPSRAPASPT